MSVVGIGAAVCVSLIKAGCMRLVLVDKSLPQLEQSASLCDAVGIPDLKTVVLPCDLNDENSTEAMMKDAVQRVGPINHFVNCAAILPPHKKSMEISFQEFTRGAETCQRAVL